MIKYLFIFLFAFQALAAPAKLVGLLMDTNTGIAYPSGLILSNEIMIHASDMIATNSGRIDATALGLVASATYNGAIATNNSTIITTVGSAKSLAIYFPSGRFFFNQGFNFTTNISLIGAGIDQTILCITNAPVINNAFIFITGSTNILPLQAADITNSAQQVTFASPPSLNKWDDYFVVNTNQSSFSPWRTYYYQGEALKVADINGSVVTNTSRNYASYTGTTNIFYKLVPAKVTIKDISFEFSTGVSSPGLRISLASDFVIQNVRLVNSRSDCFYIDRCVRGIISNVRGYDSQSTFGESYGGVIGNSQYIISSDCDYSTTRHGNATGGADVQPAIPNRELYFYNCRFGSGNQIIGVPGLNLHGNIEYAYFYNCEMPSGIEDAGNHIYFYNCNIANGEFSGRAYVWSEITGTDHQLINCNFRAVQSFNSGFISPINRLYNTAPKNIFKIYGGTIDTGVFTSSVGAIIYPADFTYPTGTSDYSIDIQGVDIVSTTTGPLYGIYYHVPVTNSLDTIIFKNNHLIGVGIKLEPNLKNAIIENNTIFNAAEFGLAVSPLSDPYITNQFWSFKNNTILNSQKYGVVLNFFVTNSAKLFVDVEDNISINNGQSGAGWSSFYINGADQLIFVNNKYGDNQDIATQTSGGLLSSNNFLFSGRNLDIGIGKHPLSISRSSNTNDLGWSPNKGILWNWGTPNLTTHTNQVGDIWWNPNAGSTGTNSWLLAETIISGAPGTVNMGPPVNSASFWNWDYNNLGFAIGTTISSYAIYGKFLRHTNSNVSWQWYNQSPGSSAYISLDLVATNNQGSIIAYGSAYSTANRAGKFVFQPASNSRGASIDAVTYGQTFDGYIGNGSVSGAQTFQFSSNQFKLGSITTNISWNALALDGVGTGTPEGNFTAPIGSLFRRTDGGVGTSAYTKTSGAGNTGWSSIGISDNWEASGTTNSSLQGNATLYSITATSLTTNSIVGTYDNTKTLKSITVGSGLSYNGTTLSASGAGTSLTNSAVYASGSAYSITGSYALVDFGTDDPILTIPQDGTYMIWAYAALRMTSATWGVSNRVSLKLVSSVGPADVPNSQMTQDFEAVTAVTRSEGVIPIAVLYTGATAGETISLFAQESAAPSGGSFDIDQARIVAIRLY